MGENPNVKEFFEFLDGIHLFVERQSRLRRFACYRHSLRSQRLRHIYTEEQSASFAEAVVSNTLSNLLLSCYIGRLLRALFESRTLIRFAEN